MAYFKVADLYNRISELKQDKMEYVEITLLEPDEDDEIGEYSLCFTGIESSTDGVDYDSVESVALPDDYENSNQLF